MGLGIYLLWGMIFLPGSLTIVVKQSAEQCSKTRIARFTRNHALSFPGRELENHVIKEFSTKYQATQCAMECFLTKTCKSFNFDPGIRKCQINDATHKEYPTDLKVKNSTTEYHLRDAFWLDEKAIGPCGNSPCQNNGRCLDTKSATGDRMYICICQKGWTGKNCDAQESHTWGQWEDWGACSSSCGHGYQSRRRNCEETDTDNEVSSTKCYGRDVDFRACPFKECPRWEEWGEWGPCSTDMTCGRGYMVRHRNCSNGGKPGVDRYCVGSNNETTACTGITCESMVRFLRSPNEYYGEGRVEMFNDQLDTWVSVCADNWTRHAAEITCKQAGFQGAFEVVTNATYNESSSASVYITTQCDGTEKFLHECKREDSQQCSNFAGVKCRVRGVWNLWTPWSNCSVSCENGTQVRTRKCDYPPPNYGGQKCPGSDVDHQICSVPVCPIDGFWFQWSRWSTCSVTCGNGTQNRSRECNQPKYGGTNCSGEYDDVRACFPKNCPVDGFWMHWSLWSSCSVSCGNGTQNRSRECNQPKYGGSNCSGSDDEMQSCFPKQCPVDGYWLSWSPWSDCSVTCATGIQNRSRDCNSPIHGGRECSGAADEIVDCHTRECPVNGTWRPWSDWGSCNVTCGGGMKIRVRDCIDPKHGGANCTGSSDEFEGCNNATCPIDGVWKAWSQWDTCNVTCGGGGQHRYRDCDGPFFKGAPCNGSGTEWQACNTQNCPLDGVWGLWANWSRCTVTCNNGTRYRNRTCEEPRFGGRDCEGHVLEEQECNTFNCPVDGVFDLWANWSPCSKSCGNGTQERNRTCSGPYFGGKPCNGSTIESQICNEHPCPVDGYWSDWIEWSGCSMTCGNGSQERNRTCVGPYHGGKLCEGSNNETRSCNTFHCPIDGFWETWSNWSLCSTTCGGGTQSRNRTCNHPLYDGMPCNGTGIETRYCNNNTCPVDGVWEIWSIWSQCSKTCGGGFQFRNRTCNPPLFGGSPCNGTDSEIESCNNLTCPVDGQFSKWSDWDMCSVTCGGGIQWRNRSCIGPFYGGASCNGSFNVSRNCSTNECPVDGIFDTWTEWTDCDVTCGGGLQFRNRSCMGPFFGGALCSGNFSERQPCNIHECPVDGEFSDWSTWNICNVTCGGGFRSRNRTCIGPYFGGLNCTDEFEDYEECNTHYCPIDGIWEEWTEWNGCNVTCGGGIRFRYRNCSGPFFGGKKCSGGDEDASMCANNNCPPPAQWLEWERWEPCSVTCDGGTRERFRRCNDSAVEENVGPCIGFNNDTQPCHNFTCLPFARHCTELVQMGLIDSTYVEIKTEDRMSPPGWKIFCDVEAENGIGVSVIEHENMTKILVRGFEAPGSFKLIPKYSIPFDEAVKLIGQSANCSQFVEWQCKDAAMYDPYEFTWITFWINRTFDKEKEYVQANAATYFPGGTVGSGKCACGVTNTCEVQRHSRGPLKCNCNMNDNVHRFDRGYITNKLELPLRAFCAGDTGGEGGDDEYGNLTVGALKCFGDL